MAYVLPCLAAAVLVLVGASLTTGGTRQRWAGIAIASLGIQPSWFLPEGWFFLRSASCLVAFIGLMRTVDLLQGQWTLRARIVHVLSVIDTRRLVRVPRRLDTRGVVSWAAWECVALVAIAALRTEAPSNRLAFWAVRWSTCIVAIYAGVSAGYALLRAVYRAIGFETGPLHVSPIRSRSVQELWGERWARPVSLWLFETFQRPFARRRRPVTGALLAFFASAFFHAYAIWVGLGVRAGLAMAGSMLGYFLLQAVIVLAERKAGVRRWPSWQAHASTVLLMLATAPAFLEPAVRILGLSAP